MILAWLTSRPLFLHFKRYLSFLELRDFISVFIFILHFLKNELTRTYNMRKIEIGTKAKIMKSPVRKS